MEDTPADPAASTAALRAMAHPVRLRILSLLTGCEMSAAEIARELGISQANASYHLRVLAKAGEVVEAGEEKVRGGVAKKYRHPWDRNPDLSGADESAELQHLRTMAEELVRRGRLRRRRSRHLTVDAELWVPTDIADEAVELLTRAARLLHAEAKAPRTPGTVHMNLTAAAFEMSEEPPADTTRTSPTPRRNP